jgi:hypothetical protein
MTEEVLGYAKTSKDTWQPIVQPKGYIYTAAFIFCNDCKKTISSHGGPSYNALCSQCFDNFKLTNFVEGNPPV